eukprot:gnl/MRDRNA2_/MRDRNA2_34217_c0_seq1.p1 gnl/MRDRNA2_/MRDRNA2_34217_c0~~gnl/MRDRNA2_/MRDRNA2_34217_c0_seq1.p1  ORF type:complete len:849 (+),score=127.88 gnl/MRDRNA2_/MRDRNA2_34217_c0_seq1:342-2549(+)
MVSLDPLLMPGEAYDIQIDDAFLGVDGTRVVGPGEKYTISTAPFLKFRQVGSGHWEKSSTGYDGRRYGASVSVSPSNDVFIFGGRSSSASNGFLLNDVWKHNSGRQTHCASSFEPRTECLDSDGKVPLKCAGSIFGTYTTAQVVWRLPTEKGSKCVDSSGATKNTLGQVLSVRTEGCPCPACVKAPEASLPKHILGQGAYLVDGYTPVGILELKCEPGFIATGDFVCDSGSWATPYPQCIEQNCSMAELENAAGEGAKFFGTQGASGASILVECRPGFRLADPYENFATCKQGSYVEPLPRCVNEDTTVTTTLAATTSSTTVEVRVVWAVQGSLEFDLSGSPENMTLQELTENSNFTENIASALAAALKVEMSSLVSLRVRALTGVRRLQTESAPPRIAVDFELHADSEDAANKVYATWFATEEASGPQDGYSDGNFFAVFQEELRTKEAADGRTVEVSGMTVGTVTVEQKTIEIQRQPTTSYFDAGSGIHTDTSADDASGVADVSSPAESSVAEGKEENSDESEGRADVNIGIVIGILLFFGAVGAGGTYWFRKQRNLVTAVTPDDQVGKDPVMPVTPTSSSPAFVVPQEADSKEDQSAPVEAEHTLNETQNSAYNERLKYAQSQNTASDPYAERLKFAQQQQPPQPPETLPKTPPLTPGPPSGLGPHFTTHLNPNYQPGSSVVPPYNPAEVFGGRVHEEEKKGSDSAPPNPPNWRKPPKKIHGEGLGRAGLGD